MAQRGPLGYAPDKVLEVAMRLFWDHGYEGSSMSDLTEAMGINRRTAYGSKGGLFEAALARYVDGPCAFPETARHLAGRTGAAPPGAAPVSDVRLSHRPWPGQGLRPPAGPRAAGRVPPGRQR
ncbi:helix-turn-helix domain-containing protein [Micromonospora vinacea]|uniref:TetR/AcrR family transcriptional regulator n=1 Tax=Micromonospora vinacea TaxID=709878 RepID=UPI003452E14A